MCLRKWYLGVYRQIGIGVGIGIQGCATGSVLNYPLKTLLHLSILCAPAHVGPCGPRHMGGGQRTTFSSWCSSSTMQVLGVGHTWAIRPGGKHPYWLNHLSAFLKDFSHYTHLSAGCSWREQHTAHSFPCIFESRLLHGSCPSSFFLVLQIFEEIPGSWGLRCLRELRVASLPSNARGSSLSTCDNLGRIIVCK